MKIRITEELKTRFFKLYNLAEQGEGGEKDTAQKMLEKLLKANSLKIEDFILKDKTKRRFFYLVNDNYEIKLFSQTCSEYEVGLNHNIKFEYIRQRGVNVCRVELSITEQAFISISHKYEFYVKEWRDQLEAFYRAFLNRYDIYNPNAQTMNEKDISDDLRKKLDLAAKLAKSIEKKDYFTAIEGTNKKGIN